MRRGENALDHGVSILRPGAAAAMVACALVVLASAGAVQAQDVRVPFNIPAQPLANALRAFASQGKQQLLFDEDKLARLRAPAVSGNFTPREALNLLLSGSGLAATPSSPGFFTLKDAPSAPVSASDATLASVTVTAQAERDATSEGTRSYAARGTTLFKGAQSLKDIPQSVSVVTRQLMDDRNVTSVYDALSSAPGITIQQSPQGGQYIYSRGFPLRTVQYDGVPLNRDVYGRASNYLSGMAFIDRVEVLRGAAGLLQGEGSPAGAANLVRKRPLSHNALSVEARAGSWDRYGGQVDISRVLNDEGTLRGRALIDYQDQHSFIDYVNQRNATVYATLEYDISPATSVNMGFSSEDTKGRPFMNGLPRYSTGADLALPRSTYLGATWNRQQSINRGLYFDASHQFNESWKFKLSGVQIREDHDIKYAGVNGAVNPSLMRSANIVNRQLADVETSGIDANLTGAFSALGRRHEIVGGANYSKAKTDHDFSYKLNYNIFNIGSFNPGFSEPADADIYAATRERLIGKTAQYGVYSVLRWQLADPLKLVLGARASWFKSNWSTMNAGTWVPDIPKRENGKLTPYAGLIYELNPQWSAYVSYADIFQPQNSYNQAGEPLEPIVGANYEAGIKGELAEGKVNTSLALFRINQTHRAQVDFSTSPTCRSNYYCYTDSGEVQSQGLDAELSGEIAANWNIFSGYTFAQTKYLKDVANEGVVFSPDTPKHLFRLWTSYRLPGALQAVTVGGGVDAQSATYRQVGNVRVDISGRAVWSAMVKYKINRNWTAALNVNNIFDKQYYRAVAGFNNGNYYGDPRNAMLTLRGTF